MTLRHRWAGFASAVALGGAMIIATPVPADAGVGGCSSLGGDGRYIVGSCTANYPSRYATITVSYSCFDWYGAGVIRKNITVGYGSSFRVKSSCWTWVSDVVRIR